MDEGIPTPIPSTRAPSGADRRRVVTLRGALIVAVGALLLQAGAPTVMAIVLIAGFAVSEIAIVLMPVRRFGGRWFFVGLGAVDLVWIAASLHVAGKTHGALWTSALLMILIAAIGNYGTHVAAGAAAVGAFHTWLVLGRGESAFGPWDVALQIIFLCTMALYYGYVVRDIHRLRRRREAQDLQNEELRVLLEILEAINSSLDLHRVCLAIVSKLTAIIPAQRCSMLFVDPEANRCFVIASHDNPTLRMLEIDLKKYPEVRCAIDTRNAVLVQNAPDDPVMAEVRELLTGLDFRSILVVPLTFGNEVLGTLCLKTARGREEYSAGELRFCTAVARASAHALKNALLHDQVQQESGRYRTAMEKLSQILDDSPDLILTTDNDGCVTEFNRGAERLLGRPRGKVMGNRLTELFDSCSQDLIDEVRRHGKLANYSCHFRRSDQRELTLELNASSLKDEQGEVKGAVWVGRDVTELKMAQSQLNQAKKLSSIGEVISGVAHELNNPLSGVLGYSQLLVARNSRSPLARDLEKIYESALRCQKIVKNLLSFARVHKPERRYLGVNGIIDKTLELRRYQLQVNDIEVVREFDPQLPRTMLDFHQMQQVFLNLINNAQHAITATRGRQGRLTVTTRHVDGKIQIRFHDNGEGMDPETLERVFDPFFTTKEPGRGTGLGLSVSYGIVKEHGGAIYAAGRRGSGATFVIELPVRKESSSETSSTIEEVASPQLATADGGTRLLVVDDEPMILDLFVDLFDDQDVLVDTASNGNEACRKIRQRPYDVVITDVRMPQMNGFELYTEIITMRPEMEGRIIFMTGDLVDDQTVRFLSQVNARSIAKPLEIPVVLSAVSDTLEPRQQRV